MPTKIEWTDEVWNPFTGCTKVSVGCANCYAERNFPRAYPGRQFSDVRMHLDRIVQPLKWKKPRKVFVCSMGDMFHEALLDNWIHLMFAIMAACPDHTFQVLTKRPERMRRYMSMLEKPSDPIFLFTTILHRLEMNYPRALNLQKEWPLPNVWLGVTAENQETAEERIPILLNTPATHRFVSCEPLLGPIALDDLYTGRAFDGSNINCLWMDTNEDDPIWNQAIIDWVIVGGESGPKARPMHPKWAMDIRDACQVAEVPFFFKQWGEWKPVYNAGRVRYSSEVHTFGDQDYIKVGKKAAGRELDGKTWEEFPE